MFYGGGVTADLLLYRLLSTVTETSLNSVLSFWSPFIMAKQASEQLMGWF